MKTLFITSPDHVRRAYDQIGNGATNFLVHGEGSNRQAWPEVGYVERLREELTVISLDLRDYGEAIYRLIKQITPQVKWGGIFWPLLMPAGLSVSLFGNCLLL